jgi:proline iminopeptidase
MKAKLRGTEIYYDIAGMQLVPIGKNYVERPVLFMLHGGPGGDHLRYKIHSIELQEVAQLVFIDHRGCGLSKKTRQSDYTLENNIEDIEALRKHLGLQRISIFGTSYGGMVAQGYAIRYPHNVDKLILAVTAPSYRFLNEARQLIKERGTPQQIAICEHVWNGTFKSHAHVMKFFKLMEPFYSTTSKKNHKKLYAKSKTVFSHLALNEGFRPDGFLRSFDFIPQLKKITSPTLVIAGEKDWICSPGQARTIARHIPNSTLKIFKKSSHAVAIDVHDDYIKTIQNFLRKKLDGKKRRKK